ncbi:MAG: hypothetical protein ACREYF_00720 [Gammaproteobacteria bacterium]
MRERELAQIEERPIPVSQTIQDLPEAVDVAIMRSLEKDPDDRFQRASDFIAALLPYCATWLDRSSTRRSRSPQIQTAAAPFGREGRDGR